MNRLPELQRQVRSADSVVGSGNGQRSILKATSSGTTALPPLLSTNTIAGNRSASAAAASVSNVASHQSLTATSSSSSASSSKVRTMPIIIHFIVRPHLAPCHTDVAIVPVEARVEDIALCAANTLFAHCEAYGAVMGPLPSTQLSDYGLYLLRPRNLRLVETNRIAAATADAVDDPRAYGCLADDDDDAAAAAAEGDRMNGDHDDSYGGAGGRGGGDLLDGGGGGAVTYDSARRPTIAANLMKKKSSHHGGACGGADITPFQQHPSSSHGYHSDPSSRVTATIPYHLLGEGESGQQSHHHHHHHQQQSQQQRHVVVLPPTMPHPSQHFMAVERTELGILEEDFDCCLPKAMLLRFLQTAAEKRTAAATAAVLAGIADSGGGGDRSSLDLTSTTTAAANGGGMGVGGDEDPVIVAAKVKARVDALYQFNRNAQEDEQQRADEADAALIHTKVANMTRPPEVYFCLTAAFLERETLVCDEEERRAGLELIFDHSWERLLGYAALWAERSLAAQRFRESNATSRNHMQACETRVRAKLVAREDAEWQERFSNFAERFVSLELGMLAQYHHMRRLRHRHRGEIDRRLVEEGKISDAEEASGGTA